MQLIDQIANITILFLPTLIVFLVFSIGLRFLHWFLIGRHPEVGGDIKFPIQILLLTLGFIGISAILLSLPIDEKSRDNIFKLIGILISGVIVFSSTNIVANFMAGVLLRITKPFKTGDFIHTGEYFGRVSERGFFDTEIQSENRELIAIPNSILIKNPVATIRSSGAIVSATLSIGYDVHHSQIESFLIKAAEKCELHDPFVHIIELGNFSVTYRISGLLTEVKGLLTARSKLFKSVLDSLHEQGIEIMSPTIMNQRQVNENLKFIPKNYHEKNRKKSVEAEGIVFDKAEKAQQIEGEKEILMAEIKKMKAELKLLKKEDQEKAKENIEEKLEQLKVVEEGDLTNKKN